MQCLTSFVQEFQAAKKESTGLITRWADNFHNLSAAYMVKNRHLEFHDLTTYINTLAEKLAVADRVSQRVVKEECGQYIGVYDCLTSDVTSILMVDFLLPAKLG